MKQRQVKNRWLTVALIAAVPVAAVLLWFLLSHGGPGGKGPPNVLLITIDTLRADRLGCYGYLLETSPHIDSLAARGVRFTDCTVQWPKTWPSIASLLTGAYPKSTNIRLRPRVLSPSLNLLSDLYRANGYNTGAVVANFNIGKAFGFHQGFDHFKESWVEKWRKESGDRRFINRPGRVKEYTNATLVTDQALAWLEGRGSRKPFFLWLHYMDPHGPYVPPEKYNVFFEDAHEPEPTELDNLPEYQLQKREGESEPISDLSFYRRQYDREVRYVDDEIRRLCSELYRMKEGDNTIIVVTADHGESFNEHNYYLEHGKLPYQACAHVPLIIVREDVLPAGVVVEDPVGLIDLTATLVSLSNMGRPDTFEGQDLSSLILSLEEKKAPDLFGDSWEVGQDNQIIPVISQRHALITLDQDVNKCLEDWNQCGIWMWPDSGTVHYLLFERQKCAGICRLPPVAATVVSLCDGKHTLAEIYTILEAVSVRRRENLDHAMGLFVGDGPVQVVDAVGRHLVGERAVRQLQAVQGRLLRHSMDDLHRARGRSRRAQRARSVKDPLDPGADVSQELAGDHCQTRAIRRGRAGRVGGKPPGTPQAR